MKNYSQIVRIQSNQKRAFAALTRQIDKWWGKVDIPPTQMDDKFTVSFGEAYWTFRISILEKFNRVSWECIAANQVHKGLENMGEEWLGTILHWKITQKENQLIDINFIHEGLVPDLACYEVCSTTWDYFITERLKEYLEIEVDSV